MPDRYFELEALQGETVDQLCNRHYGKTRGFTEAVLEANPGLARLGVALPMGTRVRAPVQDSEPAELELVQLWD